MRWIVLFIAVWMAGCGGESRYESNPASATYAVSSSGHTYKGCEYRHSMSNRAYFTTPDGRELVVYGTFHYVEEKGGEDVE